MAIPRGVFLGLATLDVIQYVPHAPGPDAKATSRAHALAAGGPATNAAVTFAALGGTATLITALGDDPAGAIARADLTAHGVRLLTDTSTSPESAETPVSAITVSTETGQRSIVGSDAATAKPLAVTEAHLAAALAGADVLLLDGHYPDASLRAARVARSLGVPVVLDVGRWKPVFAELIPLADHAVCSEGVRPPGREDADHAAALAALRRLGANRALFTRGSAPVLVDNDDDAESPHALAVPAVLAVDTLGAGDAFHGAYAYAIAAGRPPTEAAEFAIEVAAVRVQHEGPRAWLKRLSGR